MEMTLDGDLAEGSDVIVTMGCGDTAPVFPANATRGWTLTDLAASNLAGRMGSIDRAGIDRPDRRCLITGGLYRQDNSPLWVHGAGQGGGDRWGYPPVDGLTDEPADRNPESAG